MSRRTARRAREVPEIRMAAAIHGMRGPNADGNYATNCPFCEADPKVGREDRERKLTIKISGQTTPAPGRDPVPLSPDHGAWNCYRCGARGFADFSWMVSGEEAEVPRIKGAPKLGPPPGFVPIAECAKSVTMRWAAEYLHGRGVLHQATLAGAGACAKWVHEKRDGGEFEVPEGRVVVPHYAGQEGWAGYSARLVRPRPGRESPKYLYPRGMDRRTALWGVPFLASMPIPIYVVEGVFDALPLLGEAVATFGKGVSEEQVQALVDLGRRGHKIVACLDGDAREESKSLARRVLLKSRSQVEVAWCEVPNGLDPGVLGPAVRALVRPLA